jgi:HEAT repeat protein
VPAFEALCRRFSGFGLTHTVPEQVAAVKALAALGGREASAALVRILCDDVMQGPGLGEAVHAAAALGAQLPVERGMVLLRHAEPAVRAQACRCVPLHPSVVAILVDLLGDLHPTVATAAACALGHFGHREARPILGQLLREEPTAGVIVAVVAIADADLVVQLGRIARTRPDLTVAVKAALEEIDNPLAGAVLATLSSHASDPHHTSLRDANDFNMLCRRTVAISRIYQERYQESGLWPEQCS